VLAAHRALGAPIVAHNAVRFAVAEHKPVLDVLHCIRRGITLDEAGRELLPNAEARLRSPREMAERFADHPEWVARTREIASACTFSLRELKYAFPCAIPEGETADSLLRRMTYEGAASRYGPGKSPKGDDAVPGEVRALIEKELALIAKLEVAPYFLSVRAIVDIARERDILCQGRGSAANSAVCFCLGVTAVDPARSSLLFERFLSAERKEPPDIDVDFEHERREEVIQEIYRRWGRDRAAMVSEVICYRGRSALREVGKVFGFSLEQVDQLASMVTWWEKLEPEGKTRREMGAKADLDPEDSRVRQCLRMAAAIQGYPRHLSIHVGGFVLSAEPLERIAPVEPATMKDRTVVPWDKDDIDALGFFKVDVLGLGMLTAIRKALLFVKRAFAPPVPPVCVHDLLAAIPAEDPTVYDALCRADTVGVFQIESRAQMAMLPRLRPRCFYDLVIEVAIVRPGPIQGGMVHPYLRRRNGEEPIDVPHEILRPILARTLGVPLFQEQVMQIAIVGAGYSGGEADQLRRDMAAWRRNGKLVRHRERLKRGFAASGISEDFGERLYKQIQGFGEYGFPECIVGETLVIDASTGRRVAIEDVAAGRAKLDTTFACDEHFRLRKRRVLAATRSGEREVFRLRTALGRTVTATAEHPLRTLNGWRPLASLSPGDFIATARSLPAMGRRRWRRHELVVLGDLVAEGNLCHPTTFYFYTTDSDHAREFVAMVERFPNTRATIARHRSCFSIHVRRKDRRSLCGALAWAEKLNLRGVGAHDKRLPPDVFRLHVDDVALLLARLWEGDGHLSNARHASYDTASAVLAEQVRHLLLRLGIIARLYRRDRPYRGRIATGYTVTITGADNLKTFYERVARRFLGRAKKEKAKRLARESDERLSSRDVVPAEVYEHVRRAREKRGCTWNEIGSATRLALKELHRPSRGKLGFRRWVIERLGKYLKSSLLEDLGTSDVYWDRVVSIERLGARETYDLTIEGDANFLANDVVVHNSHAASFALLVYASAWLKVHHPAAFAAALVNSQPMGFYSPSSILADAKRHGVGLLPIRVEYSNWDCTVHPVPPGELIRVGLRLVKGLGEEAGRRVEAGRPFESVEDLRARAALDQKEMDALAEAGALNDLVAGGARAAMWSVRAPRGEGLFRGIGKRDGVELPPLTRTEQLVLDFERTGLSIRDHPMLAMRAALPKTVLGSVELQKTPHGRRVTTAGLVICRQRPGTASGVVFMTLEDEHGFVNLILWAKTFERFRRVATTSGLLLAHGTVEATSGVVHVMVERLERLRLARELPSMSRDFH
jgi:DNA polymerase III alpha subunit/intein/homing endonuclease